MTKKESKLDCDRPDLEYPDYVRQFAHPRDIKGLEDEHNLPETVPTQRNKAFLPLQFNGTKWIDEPSIKALMEETIPVGGKTEYGKLTSLILELLILTVP